MKLPTARRRLAAGRAWWARSLYGSGLRRMRELDLDTHALALCAQQVLCTAPLIVAISAVLQRINGNGISVYMSRFFGLHGDSAHDVERLFGRTSPTISTVALIFAMVTAVVFSTSVGAVQQRAFEMIWTLPRVRSVWSYVRQLVWAVGLAVFSLGILAAARCGRWFNREVFDTGSWAPVVMQGALTFLFYWWSQRWLLGGRLTWRALLPGALAVGVATTILVRITRVVLPEEISWQVHAYGLIGGIFVLSVWLMILSVVVFGGVLFGALYVERRTAVQHTDPGVAGESPLTLTGLASTAIDPDPPAGTDGTGRQDFSSMYSSTSRSESSMPRPSGWSA
ncbi:MAG TPA: YhjD/YihY/BrkB family envelope integrity protein [Jatrophihabitans sp.]|nr:YhjD/YihY/BrkB family envelope integrity protein [Jatrophihabitans sp.]